MGQWDYSKVSKSFVSKKLWFFLLGIVLIIITSSLGTLVFSDSFARGNADLIRTKMWLTEIAKPTIIYHTEKLNPTDIISHPKPKLTVDDKILRDLNCPPDENGIRYCSQLRDTGQSASLGCFSINTPNSLLGGLRPSYPMAECLSYGGRYVHQRGCNISVGTAYIIERGGRYEIIDSQSMLKAVFAPIESENAALSFAIAATGYSALYGTEILPNTEYLVGRYENTHVEKRGDEYLVRLFDYSLCGCSQHETIGIDVVVSRQGDIREIYREVVYRDARLSCID